MRILFFLFIALGVTALFALFPEAAGQPVYIDAFGWVLETRQGAFIVAMLLILGTLWLLRRIVSALIAGPGQLWQTLRVGGKKRREQRLREGLAQWLDMRGDLGTKAMRKGRTILPTWAYPLLKSLTIAAKDQPLHDPDADPLNIALAARIATDPHTSSKADVATRKAHLEAWLAVHPGAPLALIRLADIAEEEEDWSLLANLLEDAWKGSQQSSSSIKPRLAHAYAKLAENESDERQNYLRKAHRLAPDNEEVILALGQAHLASKDREAAHKLWATHLEKNDSPRIAEALYNSMSDNALQAFQQLDRKESAPTTPSLQWLRAILAHKAGLTGLSTEILDKLLKRSTAPYILQTRADWHLESGDCKKAAEYYRKALAMSTGQGPESDLQK